MKSAELQHELWTLRRKLQESESDATIIEDLEQRVELKEHEIEGLKASLEATASPQIKRDVDELTQRLEKAELLVDDLRLLLQIRDAEVVRLTRTLDRLTNVQE